MPEPETAAVLLQTALILVAAVAVHVYAVRHVSRDDVPALLLRQVEWSVRARPWVVAVAVAMGALGLAGLW